LISPETVHAPMLQIGCALKTLRWILHALACELR
jgi:hypothetical protein